MSSPVTPRTPSSYLRHLPGLYADDPLHPTEPFWGRFLNIFETVLSGRPDGVVVDAQPVEGIETIIDRVPTYFISDSLAPGGPRAPRAFLNWLAQWVALTLRQDWSEVAQRDLIRRVVSIYPIRGTAQGVEQMLDLYLRASDPPPPGLPPELTVSIVEYVPLEVGVKSTVGVDTWIGGGPPHHFTVRIDFDRVGPRSLELKPPAVMDIVEREKPAHTYYSLEILIPTLQVGVRSTVAVDTVLGNKNT
jgi:hypothetical protein